MYLSIILLPLLALILYRDPNPRDPGCYKIISIFILVLLTCVLYLFLYDDSIVLSLSTLDAIDPRLMLWVLPC